ncbi:MAG: hypothetical protein HY815_14470 [Candidatus Riflebacteria bacterium]|nr:hypothetical protein [Candidatus Riflebacteria bacterium]
MAQAARWAVGALRDLESGPRLEEVVGGADPGGVAAWALGEIGNVRSVDALRRALTLRLTGKTPDDLGALGPTIWALWKLGGPRALDRIEVEAGRAGLTRSDGDWVKGLLTGLRSSPGSGTTVTVDAASGRHGAHALTLALLPLVPFQRTGITLHPGDWVKVSCAGGWSIGAAAPLVDPVRGQTVPVPGHPALRVMIRVGGDVRVVDKQEELLYFDQEGELTVSPYAARVMWTSQRPLSATRGLACLTLTSSACRPASAAPPVR